MFSLELLVFELTRSRSSCQSVDLQSCFILSPELSIFELPRFGSSYSIVKLFILSLEEIIFNLIRFRSSYLFSSYNTFAVELIYGFAWLGSLIHF